MKFHRIISRLDIKGPNLVKGIHLEGLRVLGKPEIFAKYYFNQGVDELFYQDVVASLYQRNSLIDKIKETAKTYPFPHSWRWHQIHKRYTGHFKCRSRQSGN